MIPPAPFTEAARRLRRSIQPTALTSAEIGALDVAAVERAFISARNALQTALAKTHRIVTEIAQPVEVRRPDRITPENPTGAVQEGRTLAQGRAELKKEYRRLGYQPEEGKRGTIEDLSSDARINLVITHNVTEARAYGQHVRQQQEPELQDWPAYELVRLEGRKVPRLWVVRWQAAGGKVFPGGREKTLLNYRLAARKDDPIWTAISRFGRPWAPYDFNSGLGRRPLSRAEAIALGLVTASTVIAPSRQAFNDPPPPVVPPIGGTPAAAPPETGGNA